jgi:hypothetical protein
LEEAWDVYGEMMPGFEPVPGRLVGKAFERSVDGFITGEVIFVDACCYLNAILKAELKKQI